MREIKFRAWIKQDNGLQSYPGMYPVIVLGPDSCMVDRASVFAQREFPLSVVELLQFTGLKDKNGKEVYDGDIIGRLNEERCWKVVWHQNDARWMLQDIVDGTLCPLTAWPSIHQEVMGNIRENKDLLATQ